MLSSCFNSLSDTVITANSTSLGVVLFAFPPLEARQSFSIDRHYRKFDDMLTLHANRLGVRVKAMANSFQTFVNVSHDDSLFFLSICYDPAVYMLENIVYRLQQVGVDATFGEYTPQDGDLRYAKTRSYFISIKDPDHCLLARLILSELDI